MNTDHKSESILTMPASISLGVTALTNPLNLILLKSLKNSVLPESKMASRSFTHPVHDFHSMLKRLTFKDATLQTLTGTTMC